MDRGGSEESAAQLPVLFIAGPLKYRAGNVLRLQIARPLSLIIAACSLEPPPHHPGVSPRAAAALTFPLFRGQQLCGSRFAENPLPK